MKSRSKANDPVSKTSDNGSESRENAAASSAGSRNSGHSDHDAALDPAGTGEVTSLRESQSSLAAGKIRQVTQLAMMLAVIEVAKRALDFLPNVELVTFLFLVFTLLYGKKVVLVAFAFTGVETLYFGGGLWVIMYLYVWPLEILMVDLLHKRFPKDQDGYWWYCIAAALFGLFFGAFCTVPYWVIGGPKVAIAWWIAGIPMDIVHGVSNFLVCLVLFRPVMKALRRLEGRM